MQMLAKAVGAFVERDGFRHRPHERKRRASDEQVGGQVEITLGHVHHDVHRAGGGQPLRAALGDGIPPEADNHVGQGARLVAEHVVVVVDDQIVCEASAIPKAGRPKAARCSAVHATISRASAAVFAGAFPRQHQRAAAAHERIQLAHGLGIQTLSDRHDRACIGNAGRRIQSLRRLLRERPAARLEQSFDGQIGRQGLVKLEVHLHRACQIPAPTQSHRLAFATTTRRIRPRTERGRAHGARLAGEGEVGRPGSRKRHLPEAAHVVAIRLHLVDGLRRAQPLQPQRPVARKHDKRHARRLRFQHGGIVVCQRRSRRASRATGRPLAFARPSAKNDAPRSSTSTYTRMRSGKHRLISNAVMASAVERDPGLITVSHTPHRASSSKNAETNSAVACS